MYDLTVSPDGCDGIVETRFSGDGDDQSPKGGEEKPACIRPEKAIASVDKAYRYLVEVHQCRDAPTIIRWISY